MLSNKVNSDGIIYKTIEAVMGVFVHGVAETKCGYFLQGVIIGWAIVVTPLHSLLMGYLIMTDSLVEPTNFLILLQTYLSILYLLVGVTITFLLILFAFVFIMFGIGYWIGHIVIKGDLDPRNEHLPNLPWFEALCKFCSKIRGKVSKLHSKICRPLEVD